MRTKTSRGQAWTDRCKKEFRKQARRKKAKILWKASPISPRSAGWLEETGKTGHQTRLALLLGPLQGVQSRWHVYHARSRDSCHALHAKDPPCYARERKPLQGFTLLATQCRALPCIPEHFSFPSIFREEFLEMYISQVQLIRLK